MPAPRGPQLKENDLHSVLGGKRLYQAEADIEAGNVVVRELYLNGSIQARWSLEPGADRTMMVSEFGEILLECTCQPFQDGEECRHVAGLAVAWVRFPKTFTVVDRSYTIDEFFHEHINSEDALDLGDDLLDDEDDSPAGSPEQPRLSLAPAAQRLSPTLRTGLPDLAEDYRQMLAGATLAEMRQIARHRGVAVTGTRDNVVETLALALGRPDAVQAVVSGLSPAAHFILSLLPFAVRGTRVDTFSLQTLLAGLGLSLDDKFRQAIDELSQLGLLRQASQGHYPWPVGLMLYGGAEARLSRLLPKHAQLRAVTVGPLDFVSLVTRLLFVLRARPWSARPPPAPAPYALAPMTNGWPFVPAEVAALARQASSTRAMQSAVLTVPPSEPLLTDDALAELSRQLEAEPDRLDFATRLLAQLGLIRRTPDHTLAVDENTLLQVIGQHPVQVVMPLYQAYLQSPHWIEFDLAALRTPGLRLRRELHLAYSQPPAHFAALTLHMRNSVLNYLVRMPAGEWIDLAAFAAQAHVLNAFGAFMRLPQGLALELNGRALLSQTLSDWAKSFQPWLEAFLTGPLHWQGVVDLGYDRNKLVGFRITELGALLTLKTWSFTAPELEAAAGQPLVFESDGSLRLQSAVAEPSLLGLLATLGDLRPGPGGSLVTAPTAQGALRVFEGGWDAERLIGALEQAAGQPVPPALSDQWREWSRRLGELQIYQGLALLELGDDFAFDELMANTSLSRSLLYRFGPRLAAIRLEAVDALCAELVDKGYTPKVPAPALPAEEPSLPKVSKGPE